MNYGHETENAFHELLKSQGIEASYEPDRFAVGKLIRDTKIHDSFFCPDFYLPELDLYVELTTSSIRSRNTRYKLVKAARVRFFYPDVRITILAQGQLRHILETSMKRERTLAWLEREAADTNRRILSFQQSKRYQIGLPDAA